MSIFGFGKKKEEQKQSCCCGGNCTPETMQVAEAEKKESGIKILGGGCRSEEHTSELQSH